MFDRIQHPPRGRHGGADGASARVYIKGGEELPGMGRAVIPAGQHMVLETAGGSGRGNPDLRQQSSRDDDAQSGLISD